MRTLLKLIGVLFYNPLHTLDAVAYNTVIQKHGVDVNEQFLNGIQGEEPHLAP